MRRVVGIDIHRTFGEVVIWDAGKLIQSGRVDMTRTALEGLGKSSKGSRVHTNARPSQAKSSFS